MTVLIWHNPRCSKSREALAILEEAGCEPAVRRYLEDAPSAEELRDAIELLGVAPRSIIRTKEAPYKDLGLAEADDDALIAAMAAHPILIERPIVFAGGRAVVGRPPEAIRQLIDR